MKKFYLIISVLFFINCNTSFSQTAISSENNETLPYRLLTPQNEDPNQKYPLVIYLHGSGGRGNDNTTPLKNLHPGFTDSLNRLNYPSYILIPQCPTDDAWVWFPNYPESISTADTPSIATKNTLELIHFLMKNKNIDSNRIYLTGYSLGGEGTFDLLTREPNLFACGAPVSSIADTSKAILIKDIPIWAFHGNNDKIIDVKYSRIMINSIKLQGGNPKYTEVLGEPHDCRDAAYSNPEFWKWMFEQRKK